MRTPTVLALILLAILSLVAPCLLPGQALWPMATTLLEPWSLGLDPEERAQMEARAVGSQLDKVIQHHVYNRAVREALQQGEFPWWDPHALGGVPLLGTVLPGVLYPLHWPFFVLADEYAWYGWHLVLHLAIAALGMWVLLRRLGSTSPAAMGAAIVFAFSGWMAARAHYHMLISSAAWAPWILAAIEGLLQRMRWRDIALLALAIGMSLLAGFPGVALVTLHIAAFLVLLRSLGRSRTYKLREHLYAAARVAIGTGVGLLIAAPQLVSGLQYEQRWARERIDRETWEALSLQTPQLQALAWPTAFADVRGAVLHPREQRPVETHLHRLAMLEPADTQGARSADGRTLPGTLARGAWNDNLAEMTCYVGILPLLLLLSVLVVGTSRRALLYLALALFPLAISFGWPLALGVARLLPGSGVGPPVRYLFGFTLCAAVFTGLQLDRWFASRGARAQRAAMSVLCCALLAVLISMAVKARDPETLGRTLYTEALMQRATDVAGAAAAEAYVTALPASDFRRAADHLLDGAEAMALATLLAAAALLAATRARQPWLLLAPALVLAVDLGGFFREWMPSSPTHERVSDHPLMHALRTRASTSSEGRAPRIARAGSFAVTGVRADALLPTNLASAAGIDDVQGYMVPDRRWEELLDALEPGTRRFGSGAWAPRDLQVLNSPLLDRLAVRNVLVPDALGPEHDAALTAAGWRRLTSTEDPSFERPDLTVLENDEAFAPAWFVRTSEVCAAESATVRFASAAFDAAHCALVEAPITDLALQSRSTDENSATPSEATATERSSTKLLFRSTHRLDFEVEHDVPGMLIIAETWAPGWEASVDGTVTEVHRVNHAMRGVVLPTAGRHRIKLKYQEPWPKWLILPAAGVALAALVILCFARRSSRHEVEGGLA